MATVLTPLDAAEELAVQPAKIYELIGNGSLIAIDVSLKADQRPRWRIRLTDFEAFIASRSSSPLTCPQPEL